MNSLDDDNGRVTIDTDEMGKETTYAYDGEARVIAIKDPLGHVTKREYDELGRESTVTAPSTHQTVYKYGANGKKTDVYTPGGRHYIMTHDDMGRLKTSKEGTQAATEFDYDKESNRTLIITPGSVITTNTYDPDGNLDKTIDPLGAIDYGYSADSNLTTVTMPNNIATGFGYDPADNVTSTTLGNEALMSAVFDVRNNFISGGTTTDAVDTVYNRLDQPIRMVESLTGRVTSDTLDIMGRLTSRFDKTGLTKYFYNDPRGLTTKIIDPEGHETTYTYDNASKVTGIKQDNGIVTTLGYNVDSQNTTVSAAGGAFSLVFGYQYDPDGLITTETVDGSQTIYGYDKLSRLVNWRPNGATETAYAYGLDGDRTSMTDSSGATTYSYDAGTHQLRSSSAPSGDIAYDYGDNGEVKHKVTVEGTTTYEWNDKGQLTKIAMPDSTVAFTYDARGNRTEKDVDGALTNYVYDGLKLIAEKDAGGAITAAYTYDTGGRLISVYKNSNTYYFHLNQRGDVVKITDQSKNVVASYSYDPWGNILSATGSFADEQPFRYAGYMWDVETGLYFLSARYYDPAIGRFISRDPADIGDVTPDINPYVYAEGNPLGKVDPSGLAAQDAVEAESEGSMVALMSSSVKVYLNKLRYLGYNLSNNNTIDATNKKAIKEFQRIHTKIHDWWTPLVVNGKLNKETKRAINFWRDRGQEAKNNFMNFSDNRPGTKLVAVYAYIDNDFANLYRPFASGQSAIGLAPGMAAIRKLFQRVNTGSKFPGGFKFRAYDIRHKNVTGNADARLDAYNEMAMPDGYEIKVAFNGIKAPGGNGGYSWAGGNTTVLFGRNITGESDLKREQSFTLAHELGHLFRADHCTIKDPKQTLANCMNMECCPDGHNANDCIMFFEAPRKPIWPKWCSVHRASVEKAGGDSGW